MNKNILLFVIILAIVIAGGFWMASRDNDGVAPVPPPSPVVGTPTPTPLPPGAPSVVTEHTVTYTDSGYSPASITINQGDTVHFVNESSDDSWTASDPHPVHTTYAAFDAKRGMKPGETYSFTFANVGTWRYHDHMNPTRRGTVTVIAIEAQ